MQLIVYIYIYIYILYSLKDNDNFYSKTSPFQNNVYCTVMFICSFKIFEPHFQYTAKF